MWQARRLFKGERLNSQKQQKFVDDGWAIWIDGEDTSTVYINDWLNTKGKSYVDLAVRIRGVKQSKNLHVYVLFSVSQEEIQDISLMFNDTNILQATFPKTKQTNFARCKEMLALLLEKVDILIF